MAVALVNAKIFTGDEWLLEHAVVIAAEKIVEVCPLAQLTRHCSSIDLQGARLIPGLIDSQVNGGGGLLFNDAPTLATLRTISAAHRRYGTTGLLPTLISDDLSVIQQGIAAVAQALDENLPGILGIHLEGPFLNPVKKGVHNAEKFRTLDDEAIALLSSLTQGRTLVTLAPELTTPPAIRQLVNAGVIVAGGHSEATYAQTRTALAAGLRSFTHLFNAMTPLTSREPGMVGAALEDEQSWCGIIVDGHHVHPASLKIALAAKPRGKLVLVTDAMPSVGAVDKHFTLYGEPIYVEQGRCTTADGTLAGSDLDMLAAVRNTIELLAVPFEEAIRMASRYPATLLNLHHELGTIKPGMRASMIAVDDNLNLLKSWIDGEESPHETARC
jgi:N-acetylglucosamine-6-phosphate deacetylase